MCLLFVIKDREPEHPLIILFNRDEGFDKHTRPLHWWSESENGSARDKGTICAGKDLEKGGTWAGVTRSGRLGMMTFVRKTREMITPTVARGELVPRWLSSSQSIEEHVEVLSSETHKTLGYNLVFGDLDRQYHYDNHSKVLTPLESGIHGVSNAYLNTPWWKVEKGISLLDDELFNSPFRLMECTRVEYLEDTLFAIMEDSRRAKPEEVQDTGLDYFKEEKKSSIFVKGEDYGTISSCVLTLRYDGLVRMTERSYDRKGKQLNSTTEEFRR